jgi:hypothetical protein
MTGPWRKYLMVLPGLVAQAHAQAGPVAYKNWDQVEGGGKGFSAIKVREHRGWLIIAVQALLKMSFWRNVWFG